MTDLTAKSIADAIKIIESYGLTYNVIRINSACGEGIVERVIRYSISGNNVTLTTAYFENDIRKKQ
ncbi:MAG TPA: hypothetical protein VIL26_02570 [Clostridia bacterium]